MTFSTPVASIFLISRGSEAGNCALMIRLSGNMCTIFVYYVYHTQLCCTFSKKKSILYWIPHEKKKLLLNIWCESHILTFYTSNWVITWLCLQLSMIFSYLKALKICNVFKEASLEKGNTEHPDRQRVSFFYSNFCFFFRRVFLSEQSLSLHRNKSKKMRNFIPVLIEKAPSVRDLCYTGKNITYSLPSCSQDRCILNVEL